MFSKAEMSYFNSNHKVKNSNLESENIYNVGKTGLLF